jgi:GT2 family glycosyltransferase
MTPDILIVVPTLGRRPDWLRAAVASITGQNVPARVLLVGPSRRELTDQASCLGVELLVVKQNGLSLAINAALHGADAAYVSWLGDDDILAPGSLRLVRAALEDSPTASFSYGRTRYIDARGQTIGRTKPGRWAPRYLTLGKDFVPQPGSLIRHSALRAVGYLDESLNNAMDLDLFIRLRAWGKPVYVPYEVSAYRVHAGSITATKGSADEAECVRRAHLRPAAQRWYPMWRPVTRLVDRAVDASFRRLPAPPPASELGRPYTQPAAAQ